LTVPEILFLSQEDVIAAGGLDMSKALEDMELALRLHGKGEVNMPPKVFLPFKEADGETFRAATITMPVYVGGGVQRAGVKWAAESMVNVRRGDLPYGIDLVVLHDVDRAHAVAVMDGTLITAMRTSAVTGVAIRYLARPESRVAGLVGAGVIGRTTLETLCHVLPDAEQVRLCDLNRARAEELAEEFSARLPVRVVDDAETALRGADVCITMTTSRIPYVRAEWIASGSLFAHVAANEAEGEVILQADRLVVDEWAQISHYHGSAFWPLLQKGQVHDEDVTNLGKIVAGKAPGRRTPEERIFFDSFGMACEDIVVAERIYQEARRQGLGHPLRLWETPWAM
jgi:ornithine cyclodeaminase/alanine dehydrogenase-like protein (mu-crystallin family)